MPSPATVRILLCSSITKFIVNLERKTCGERYYESRINLLKDEHSKRWWDEMKRLSGAN